MKFAISGTRHTNFVKDYQRIHLELVLRDAIDNNHEILVGDCPSGIDLMVRNYLDKRRINYTLFEVIGNPIPSDFRKRTIQMVTECTHLFSFPSTLSHIRSGTWLATFEACRQQKPVFVCWDNSAVSNFDKFPLIKEIQNWKSIEAHQYFSQPVLKVKECEQLNLFGV